MNDKGLKVEELIEIIRTIDQAPASWECFKKVGYLNPEKKELYKEKYDYFVYTNGKKNLNGKNQDDDNRIKGKALEDLVSILFDATGEYFNIYRNIRNGSNEVDLLVCYTQKAKALSLILDKKYSDIICECKNYEGSVKVTYVGKFYSLVQSANMKIGIIFSYNGFSGESWGGGAGLSKKLFLLKEQEQDKIYILDFNINDFKSILDGKSLFEILDDKCRGLRLGVDDITKYIVKHPNEDKI